MWVWDKGRPEGGGARPGLSSPGRIRIGGKGAKGLCLSRHLGTKLRQVEGFIFRNTSGSGHWDCYRCRLQCHGYGQSALQGDFFLNRPLVPVSEAAVCRAPFRFGSLSLLCIITS